MTEYGKWCFCDNCDQTRALQRRWLYGSAFVVSIIVWVVLAF